MNHNQPKRRSKKPTQLKKHNHQKQHQRNKSHQHTLSTSRLRSISTSTSITPLHTPHFQQFGGLAELNSSTRKLHLPESQNISVTKDEVNKLTKLAYLTPIQSDEDVQRVSTSVNKMVNWMSSITSINTASLPHTQHHFNTIIRSQKSIQKFYSNDPTPIPFYTPLILLPQYVSSSALHTSNSPSNINLQDNTTTDSCVLRMRKDIVQQCDLTAVLSNATHNERSFYVAPKFAGEE